MDGPGHQFLARAALPADEHRGPGGGHPLYQGQNLPHGLAFPHDVRGAVFFIQVLEEHAILLDEVVILQGPGDGHQQFFIFKGL